MVGGAWARFLSAMYAPALIARVGARWSIALSMLLLTFTMALAPVCAVAGAGGDVVCADGIGARVSGVAMNTSLMEQVPQHFMGRVQNTFISLGTFLQVTLGLAVGWIASRVSLTAGFG